VLDRYELGVIMGNESKYKQLNFKLTAKQLDDLECLSNAMGNVSKSNLIRIAITEYIMKYKDLLVED
jgi:metal-responsive CopG/Arc/MetJ family transcriptional regulator